MSKKLLQAAAGAAGEALYVEDVFSTYLYAGTGATQTITNGIDLSGEGGLVWTKNRNQPRNHNLVDTERGVGLRLKTNSTDAEYNEANGVTSFNSDGYSLSTATDYNANGDTYASWTFRKAPKFFDVVTYTGDGVAGRTVAHNLGSVPAMIIVKSTDGAGQNWRVYHTSLGATSGINLNDAGSSFGFAGWNNTAPTDSVFSVNASGYSVNDSGFNYVAYVFASDAGGFGDDDESIIKCGSYTGNGSTDGPTVTLGFEPQWLMIRGTGGGDWQILDNMRGIHSGGTNDARLLANSSAAEYNSLEAVQLQATGFKIDGTTGGAFNGSGSNYIYIAIRRPMMTPTAATEVFAVAQRDTASPIFEGGFPVDAAIIADVSGAWVNSPSMGSRLTGTGRLATSNTNAEASDPLNIWDYMNGWGDGSGSYPDYYSWMFKRATGFFDVVAYTGDGTSSRDITHNLGAVPEFIVTKRRDSAAAWAVYHPDLGITSTSAIRLNTNDGWGYSQLTRYPSTPTSTVYTIGNDSDVNTSSGTYVSYLFATLAGVSKVGSYTGTGADLNVDCGFSAGARWVMIKRYGTSTTGDWYVWDSVRGIVAGNDPYLLLNSSAAEVTSTDYIDPLSNGFTVTSSAPAALNASGGTYIYLSIA